MESRDWQQQMSATTTAGGETEGTSGIAKAQGLGTPNGKWNQKTYIHCQRLCQKEKEKNYYGFLPHLIL